MTNKEADGQQRDGNWLGACRRKTYSQDGEEGVVERIFTILPSSDKWCAEFGAWDGVLGSNTHFFLKEKGWSGVLIEGDRGRYEDLCRNYSGNDRAICLNRMVALEGGNSLDAILASTPIPTDFDLLSIDVDGMDYHIWESMVRYKPKVVVIEFNGTIPDTISFVQPRDFSVSQGNSLLAMCELGRKKGYELIAAIGMNAFFVDSKYYSLFGIADNSLEAMNAENRARFMTQIHELFDGTLVLSGCTNLLWHWHGIGLSPLSIQVLPRFLRFCPNDRTPLWKRVCLKVFVRMWQAREYLRGFGDR